MYFETKKKITSKTCALSTTWYNKVNAMIILYPQFYILYTLICSEFSKVRNIRILHKHHFIFNKYNTVDNNFMS